jgi:flagellar assembly protein FliH
MSSLLALTKRDASGFRHDRRFSALLPANEADDLPPEEPAEDPLAVAFAEGYARGAEDARAAAAREAAAAAAARAALDLSLTRLDAEMAEELRQRLQDTVMALCESMLAPFALDMDALTLRVERAVAMLNRAEDDRVIRLNPEDLQLVSPRLPQEWKIVADATLQRGALRVECATGGVEDGPAQWRRALAEALHPC